MEQPELVQAQAPGEPTLKDHLTNFMFQARFGWVPLILAWTWFAIRSTHRERPLWIQTQLFEEIILFAGAALFLIGLVDFWNFCQAKTGDVIQDQNRKPRWFVYVCWWVTLVVTFWGPKVPTVQP